MPFDEKRAYFDKLAREWDSIPRPPDAPARIARFCQRGLPRAAEWILDVGSGTGLLAPHLLKNAPGSVHLVEADYSLEMLRQSRLKNEDPRIARVCADALRLPLPSGRFDAVLCFGILPHLGDPGESLPELWRLLRPSGVLTVGHLMGSTSLNELHRDIGGVVADDHLPPADHLARLLRDLGAASVDAEDSSEGYFVRAKKGPTR